MLVSDLLLMFSYEIISEVLQLIQAVAFVRWVLFICLHLSKIFHAARKEVNSSHPVTLNYSETISIFQHETPCHAKRDFILQMNYCNHHSWDFLNYLCTWRSFNTGCPCKNILMCVWSLCVRPPTKPVFHSALSHYKWHRAHARPFDPSLKSSFVFTAHSLQCKILNAINGLGVHRVSRFSCWSPST